MRAPNAGEHQASRTWVSGILIGILALVCVGLPGLRRTWVAAIEGFPTQVTYPTICATTQGLACTTAVREAIQQSTWRQTGAHLYWPPGMDTWPPAIQLFTAINLERIAFHRPPITALVAPLDEAAQTGASHHSDPTVPGVPTVSVWAQAPTGMNALFLWLFDDGYASPNTACGAWNLAGCWIHRADLLTIAAPSGQIVTGIAQVPSHHTESIAWIAEAVAHLPPHPIITWAEILQTYPRSLSPMTFGPPPLPWMRVLWIWLSRLGIVVVILGIGGRFAWQAGILGLWLPSWMLRRPVRTRTTPRKDDTSHATSHSDSDAP